MRPDEDHEKRTLTHVFPCVFVVFSMKSRSILENENERNIDNYCILSSNVVHPLLNLFALRDNREVEISNEDVYVYNSYTYTYPFFFVFFITCKVK